MMLARSLAAVGRHQLENVRRLTRREPLMAASLNSMTLDMDDVRLARTWLQHRQHWYRRDEVEQYEAAFAAWNGSMVACSFMSGRVALSAIIDALRLSPGDEVILPGYTCVVVPNAFQYAGVNVVYSDIELDSYGLDASLLESKITSRTTAIVIQHLYGLICRDYEQILDLAHRRHLYVIEDCAHSTGAELNATKVGNWGHAAFYSSQNSKVFNTVQGGIAVTNDIWIGERLRAFQERAALPSQKMVEDQLYTLIYNYYTDKHPQHWWAGDIARFRYRDRLVSHTTRDEKLGIRPVNYGCRMPAVVAALGLNQLAKIDRYNDRRRETARRWDEWCDRRGYQRPLVVEGSRPVYLRYPVMVEPERKKDTSWARRELAVYAGVWFASHLHPVGRSIENCPKATDAVRRCINFPSLLSH
jgi:perosamine synthetase